jgi:Cu(I)/Ag(I) efflux system membrane fusion protein
MKNIIQNKYVIAIICLAIGISAGMWFAPDQQTEKTHQHETKDGTIYTCSMHPQIRQNEPGNCPICGMELIPVEETNNEESARAVKMSATAKKLANIQTSIVKRSEPVKTLRLDGEIVPDETADVSQAVHFEGRIEELYADYEGKYISTGDEIGKVYSQEVMIAQRELLQAVESGNESLKNAAIAKLRNYKISKKSIDKILSSDKIYETLPIYAHKSGIITKVNVSKGDHVHKGDALYTLTDYRAFGSCSIFSKKTFSGLKPVILFNLKLKLYPVNLSMVLSITSIQLLTPKHEQRKPGLLFKTRRVTSSPACLPMQQSKQD